MKRFTVLFLLIHMIVVFAQPLSAQSEAHDWIELLLDGIRGDLARPTVHARNLHHTSAVMYDTWAIFNDSETYLLGKTIGEFTSDFEGFTPVGFTDEEATIIALDYAAYRLLRWRFLLSPGAALHNVRLDNYMLAKGYNLSNIGVNYQSGDPVQLGNYIYSQYRDFGLQDGSREEYNYNNSFYEPVNESLIPSSSGNPNLTNPNRWQPLTLSVFIDQSGNVIPGNTPEFLSPEWGEVTPFALENPTEIERDGDTYKIYIDPGFPWYLDAIAGLGTSEQYEWGFSLVSKWQSHHDPTDGVLWDISPGASGNLSVDDLPTTFEEYKEFYKLPQGGDPGQGRPLNPKTGLPYEANLVKRGDYTRVLAEFWADGPDSETPPGHWFSLLLDINEHPELVRKFEGKGEELSQLEWDIKTCFTLGAAMHDAAINTWALKGYYDYIRPVSAIRYLAELGQSSDPNLPNYHPAGIKLDEGLVELIDADDPLAGVFGQNVGEIKLYTWRGPDFIPFPETTVAGVGWIMAADWWPYQRPSFVTPNFSGYVSGHSTFSRAAAEVLTYVTGDEYFPGGMGVFSVEKDEFLVFEDGPSESFELQWATYRDASDQTSLSRIWGGIHPPIDDIPGRIMGIQIAEQAFAKAKTLFSVDEDGDGYNANEDCDDTDPDINPGQSEICDGIDNDCNGQIDDGLDVYMYYIDNDGDGFGDIAESIETCLDTPPAGYVTSPADCDDTDGGTNPMAIEICDDIDNNCDGAINAGIAVFTYFRDVDNDGYGDVSIAIDTCLAIPPEGFVMDATDCDDLESMVNPGVAEICDAIDNNCSGVNNEGLAVTRYYQDFDNDGYGELNVTLDTCLVEPPLGFVTNADDCNDGDAAIYPGAVDIADNGIDEDCSGYDLYMETKIFANPVVDKLEIRYDTEVTSELEIYNVSGQLVAKESMEFDHNFITIDMSEMIAGVYWLRILQGNDIILEEKLVKN